MSLSEQIQSDLTAGMKARDSETVATLRLIVAGIRNANVAPGRAGTIGDAEVLDVLAKQARSRSEAAAAYANADRPELAAKEDRELEIIRRYLPDQLSQEALRALVDEAAIETGASGPGDLGKVMSAVMPKVKGRADGKQVNALVRARLGA